jgi:hypothetical protein
MARCLRVSLRRRVRIALNDERLDKGDVMKKYAIIIGENNEELSKQVQEALFKVGFEWNGGSTIVQHTCDGVLFFPRNSKMQAYTTVGSFIASKHKERCEYELLSPSYVLANAHLLDGARKPEDVAPDGYKIATLDDIKKAVKLSFEFPDSKYWSEHAGQWRDATVWNYNDIIAVPLDFTFEAPAVKETLIMSKFHEESVKTLRMIASEIESGELVCDEKSFCPDDDFDVYEFKVRKPRCENEISVTEATEILKKHLGDNVRITI